MKSFFRAIVGLTLLLPLSESFAQSGAGSLQLSTDAQHPIFSHVEGEKTMRFVYVKREDSVSFSADPTKTLTSLNWTFENGDPGTGNGNGPHQIAYKENAQKQSWGKVNAVKFTSKRTDENNQNCVTTDKITCRVIIPKIRVLKKGESDPPADGLVVVKDQDIEMKLIPEVSATCKYPPDKPTWHYQQLNGDGSWGDWQSFGANAKGPQYEHKASIAGIFRVKAVFDEHTEILFERESDEDHSPAKKFDPDAFGVVDKEIYNTIRLTARAELGSVQWAFAASNPPFQQNTNKCNQFVANMIEDAGGTVPRIYYPSNPQVPELPLANQWAGTTDTDPNTSGHQTSLQGWSEPITDTPKAQPGWVIAYPRSPGSGHLGILDYDGRGIGAGNEDVNKDFDYYGSAGKDGPTRHRNN